MKKKFSKYKQCHFHPVNKEKYTGTLPVVCRSSWETTVCRYLDLHSACVSWKSESNVTQYISPIDNKFHRYFIDFEATFRNKNGELQTYLIEVKPKSQCSPPTRRGKFYQKHLETYAVNCAKWESAREYAQQKGKKFIILTEEQIFQDDRKRS